MNHGFSPEENTYAATFPAVGVAHITLTHLLMLLRGIVADFGPEHNPNYGPDGSDATGCVYAKVEDGVLIPVCIVGQVFDRIGLLGLLANSTKSFNIGACSSPHQMNEFYNLLAPVVTFDPAARQVLRFAQSAQDTGVLWGEAVIRATEKAREALMAEVPALVELEGFSL